MRVSSSEASVKYFKLITFYMSNTYNLEAKEICFPEEISLLGRGTTNKINYYFMHLSLRRLKEDNWLQ